MEKQHQIQPPKLEENATETTTKIDVNLEKEKEELQSATIVATTTSVNVLPEKDEKEDYLEDVSREYRRSPTTTISRDQPVLSGK